MIRSRAATAGSLLLAATNRVFRSVGGLPLTITVGSGEKQEESGSGSEKPPAATTMVGSNNAAPPAQQLDPLFVVGTAGVLFGCLLAVTRHMMKRTVDRMFPPPGCERYSDGDSAGSSYFDSESSSDDDDRRPPRRSFDRSRRDRRAMI